MRRILAVKLSGINSFDNTMLVSVSRAAMKIIEMTVILVTYFIVIQPLSVKSIPVPSFNNQTRDADGRSVVNNLQENIRM